MNKIESIPLVETGLLSNLIADYLNKESAINNLYANFPTLKGFEHQIKNRKHFNFQQRELLVSVLQTQNKKINLTEKTRFNIHQLKSENTFTVTTGHQLNLFTGPLYVIYKILTTINLADELNKKFPENYVVPVFWMATEDHDFDEINHFWVNHKKIQWNKNIGGAVGKITTDDLQTVFNQFKEIINNQPNADYLIDLFENTYLKQDNLANANRYLINELFGKFGLVIIDGNDPQLKSVFKPFMVDELTNYSCKKAVDLSNVELDKKYKIQVTPRTINLFYLKENFRERIVYVDEQFKILNTKIAFSKDEIIEEVENFPERFSPNVLMRPLFQEKVLPNLCYVGGAGELAYWLQFKSYFEVQNVDFPILLHRNSAFILTKKQEEKLKKLKVSYSDLLLHLPQLINKKTKEITELTIDFSKERENLKSIFLEMEKIAELTDKSFIGAVKAQHQKQINGLNKLEKRLFKAEKRKHQDYINQLTKLHFEFFPNGNLQERVINISDFLVQNEHVISDLKEQLNPLEATFDFILYP